MKTKSLFMLSTLLLTLNVVQAQNNWELRRNENGITIYSRRSANGKIVELHLQCQFNATPQQLVAQILNISHYSDWVYGNKRSEVIKKVSGQDLIYFTEAHLLWPVQDRDLVLDLNTSPATATAPLTITVKSIPGYLPLKKHFIRVPYSLAVWKVTPIPGNKIAIDYTFNLDPGGSIPGWLVNLTIATGPYKSFTMLGNILNAENGK
jgi:hypothetical protein